MTNENLLREIYDIITEISVFKPKPFNKFFAENQHLSDKQLADLLRTAKQLSKLKNS